MPLNLYSSMNFFSRKIQIFFDVENWLWKSDFGTFWQLFLAIKLVSYKNQIHFGDQCNHTFNPKCFYQIPLTWWNAYIVVRIDIHKFNILMYKVFYLTENVSKYICNKKGAKMIFEDVNVVFNKLLASFWLLLYNVIFLNGKTSETS